jgi:hypothetical protein
VAAVSYIIAVGGNLETVTAGTAAPTSGSLEIRIDQTVTAVTDASYPGGTRAPRKGEIQALLRTLEEYLIRDTNVLEP